MNNYYLRKEKTAFKHKKTNQNDVRRYKKEL